VGDRQAMYQLMPPYGRTNGSRNLQGSNHQANSFTIEVGGAVQRTTAVNAHSCKESHVDMSFASMLSALRAQLGSCQQSAYIPWNH
jgi:hypothetical protein